MMQYSGASCSGTATPITVGTNLGSGACTKAIVGNVYFQASWTLFSSTTAIMNAASTAGAGLVVGTWSDSNCIYQSAGVTNNGLPIEALFIANGACAVDLLTGLSFKTTCSGSSTVTGSIQYYTDSTCQNPAGTAVPYSAASNHCNLNVANTFNNAYFSIIGSYAGGYCQTSGQVC